jgi:phosphopantothenoylcysteine decarboxylase/phosphopantothenate--cysteine ligase
MGKALAEAALERGHEVIIVSGPVDLTYPPTEVINVVSTEEMLEVCRRIFPDCDGMIGVAAPCDYRPVKVAEQKIAKTGEPLVLHLIETEDIVASLGVAKRASQWVVGFALETEDPRLRALAKLEKKHCDLIVLNGPEAMNALDNRVEVIDPSGTSIQSFAGSKDRVARDIFAAIEKRLILR